MRSPGRRVFAVVEGWYNSFFGPKNNPFYHLGALSFYFFFIIVATGIYLFLYYQPSVVGGYERMDYLSRQQWYAGGMMRSIHHYASDALVLTMVLHAVREFAIDRYRGKRWFTWFTGIPVMILLFPIGITGYWLVWDKLGQFIAVRSSEWLDWLPIIAEPMARNFLTNASVTDLFFRLMLIVHIALSIFLVTALLVHIKKISKADVLPPRGLSWGVLIAFLCLSLAKPVLNHEPGNLSITPTVLSLDWFYMFAYPLMEVWSMGTVWIVSVGAVLLLAFLPWLPPRETEHVAEVWLPECSGCGLCIDDCPYEAITLQPRTDGHPRFRREARVISENCVSCGICVGSCPSSTPFRRSEKMRTGIDLPQRSIQHLREDTRTVLSEMGPDFRLLVYTCDYGVSSQQLRTMGFRSVSLPCIGALPPSMIDYALHHGADGVFITGCRMGDCHHRFGNKWTTLRIGNKREPILRRTVPRHKIGYYWASPVDSGHLERELSRFRNQLERSLSS
jgi:quinol-cytochrome oxidoreductase complex cytochrome b subunit/coenzyme F420-reducing hydrogenase delta subunit